MKVEPPPIAKDRVAFAAGLLVILIALAPALGWLRLQSTPVFGDEYSLAYAFFMVAGVLATALYLYAASVASTDRSEMLHQWGDRLYAVAILLVPAGIGTYLIGVIQYAAFPNQVVAENVARLAMLGFLVVVILRLKPIVRALARIDAARRKALGKSKSGAELSQALELHKLGFYDMAIVAATNSMISMAESLIPPDNSRQGSVLEVYRWIKQQVGTEIEDLQSKLEAIRVARNKAAHGRLVTTAEESLNIIHDCNLIATRLAPPDVDDGEI